MMMRVEQLGASPSHHRSVLYSGSVLIERHSFVVC